MPHRRSVKKRLNSICAPVGRTGREQESNFGSLSKASAGQALKIARLPKPGAAVQGRRFGLDLYKTPNHGIWKALDALMPYDPQHPWPHEQIEKDREDSLCPALFYAEGNHPDPRYVDAIQRFNCEIDAYALLAAGANKDVARLVF